MLEPSLGFLLGLLLGFGLGVVWVLAVGCAHRLAGLYSLQRGNPKP